MHRIGRLVRGAMIFMLLAALGCGELENNGAGAEIVSLTIEPDTLSASETGMTDEFFTVTVQVAGFDDPVTDVEVFRQEPEQLAAAPQEVDIQGDTIVLERIAKSWFGGVDPGTYNIGAVVESQTQTVRQLDLATVTVTQ